MSHNINNGLLNIIRRTDPMIKKKCYWITLIPALFMTTVCSTYFFVSKQMLQLGGVGYALGIACLIVACVWFAAWYRKETNKQ